MWHLETDGGVDDLPAPGNKDAWEAGDNVYFVVEVAGAERNDTKFNRAEIDGMIVEAEPDGSLAIEWEAISADPGAWSGAPTGATIVTGVFERFDGAPLTAYAFDQEFPGLGKWLVTLAAWLFAISTMISWGYYGEQGVVYIGGQWLVLPYKLAFLALIIVAAVWVTDTDDMEALMDLGTGAMLWANMPIVLLMGFIAVRELDSYFKRLKAGEFSRLD